MTTLLETLGLELTEETKELGHQFGEGQKNGLDWYSGVKIEKKSLYEWSDWDVYEQAVDAGLVDAGIEDEDDLPDDVYVWHVDGDNSAEYFTNFEDAKLSFEVELSGFYDGIEIDELLSDKGSKPYAWLYDNADDESRKAMTEKDLTEALITQVMMHPDYDFSRAIAEYIVAENKRRFPHFFTQLFADYKMLESEAGNWNMYAPENYKAIAEYLAAKMKLLDNRGNPSVSLLFRRLIDKEIAGE